MCGENYSTCIHFTGKRLDYMKSFAETNNMEYEVREVKDDVMNPYLFVIHGTREQIEAFHTFLGLTKESE